MIHNNRKSIQRRIFLFGDDEIEVEKGRVDCWSHAAVSLVSRLRSYGFRICAFNRHPALLAVVLSTVPLFVTTLWTVAHQAPLSMGFSRPEYWSG